MKNQNIDLKKIDFYFSFLFIIYYFFGSTNNLLLLDCLFQNYSFENIAKTRRNKTKEKWVKHSCQQKFRNISSKKKQKFRNILEFLDILRYELIDLIKRLTSIEFMYSWAQKHYSFPTFLVWRWSISSRKQKKSDDYYIIRGFGCSAHGSLNIQRVEHHDFWPFESFDHLILQF